MELFSLEDDECNELFITQKDSSISEAKIDQNGQIFGDPMDFSLPMVTLTPHGECSQTQYSDISDDDFDMIPSSQVSQNSNESINR